MPYTGWRFQEEALTLAIPGNTGVGAQSWVMGAGGWVSDQNYSIFPGDWEPQRPGTGEGGPVLERHY